LLPLPGPGPAARAGWRGVAARDGEGSEARPRGGDRLPRGYSL